jgi:hypothetical protein
VAKCEHCGQEIPKIIREGLKNLGIFYKLIRNQFVYGGQKYAQTETKEATDVLFDDFGKGWLLGTIAKYCKRYSNLARERDLLKIATYMFILWLKRGFHLKKEGSYKVINTTVKAKTEFFPTFINNVTKYTDTHVIIDDNPLEKIYILLKECNDTIFMLLKEEKFLEIFYLAYQIWNKEVKEKGTDEDVYNETKKKKEKVK